MAQVNYSGYGITADPTAPRSLFEESGPEPSEYIADVTMTETTAAYTLEQERGDGTTETIGTIEKVDTSDFVTADELATQLLDYPTESDLSDALEDYPTNSDLSQTLTNYETTSGCTQKINTAQQATEAKLPTVTNGANTPKLKKITAQGDNLLLEDENGNVVTYTPTTYPVQLTEGSTVLSGNLTRIAHAPSGEENIEFIDSNGNYLTTFGIPDPSTGSTGDVLTVDSNGAAAWAAAGGGAFEVVTDPTEADFAYITFDNSYLSLQYNFLEISSLGSVSYIQQETLSTSFLNCLCPKRKAGSSPMFEGIGSVIIYPRPTAHPNGSNQGVCKFLYNGLSNTCTASITQFYGEITAFGIYMVVSASITSVINSVTYLKIKTTSSNSNTQALQSALNAAKIKDAAIIKTEEQVEKEALLLEKEAASLDIMETKEETI